MGNFEKIFITIGNSDCWWYIPGHIWCLKTKEMSDANVIDSFPHAQQLNNDRNMSTILHSCRFLLCSHWVIFQFFFGILFWIYLECAESVADTSQRYEGDNCFTHTCDKRFFPHSREIEKHYFLWRLLEILKAIIKIWQILWHK